MSAENLEDNEFHAKDVFYMLTDDKELANYRTAKLLSLLINELRHQGTLSDASIKSLLLEISQ